MGALHRGLGPMILGTESTVPSERPDGSSHSIFLMRLLELGKLGQLKEQELCSLFAVLSFFACGSLCFPIYKMGLIPISKQ